jgi:hypothetical protein
MKDKIRYDSSPTTFFTKEGYFFDNPIVTTVGIFPYANSNGTLRRELRLPEEVFDSESLASYEGKPIIVTHKAGTVTKDNVGEEIIGVILSPGYRDGDNVRCKIAIHDTDKLAQYRFRELSLGYSIKEDETPGAWNGKPYDIIQRKIRINHLAVVDDARAGDNARLNLDGIDEPKGESQMAKPAKKPATARRNDNGLSPEQVEQACAESLTNHPEAAAPPVTDEGNPNNPLAAAQDDEDTKLDADEVLGEVQQHKDRRDSEGEPATLEAALPILQEQAADIEKLVQVVEQQKAVADFADTQPAANTDGEGDHADEGDGDGPEPLSTTVTNTDAINKAVRIRVGLEKAAESVGLTSFEGMGNIALKKAIAVKVNPGIRLDGKSDTYISAMYDIAKQELSRRRGTDAQRAQMYTRTDSGTARYTTAADASRAAAIQKMLKEEE